MLHLSKTQLSPRGQRCASHVTTAVGHITSPCERTQPAALAAAKPAALRPCLLLFLRLPGSSLLRRLGSESGHCYLKRDSGGGGAEMARMRGGAHFDLVVGDDTQACAPDAPPVHAASQLLVYSPPQPFLAHAWGLFFAFKCL